MAEAVFGKKKATVVSGTVDLNAGGENLVGLNRIVRPIVLAEGVVLQSKESNIKDEDGNKATPEGYPTSYYGVPAIILYPSVDYEKPHRYIPGRYEYKNPKGYTCKTEQDNALRLLKASVYSSLATGEAGWASRSVTRKELEEGIDFVKLMSEPHTPELEEVKCTDLLDTLKKIREQIAYPIVFYVQAFKMPSGNFFVSFTLTKPDGLIVTEKEKKAKA